MLLRCLCYGDLFKALKFHLNKKIHKIEEKPVICTICCLSDQPFIQAILNVLKVCFTKCNAVFFTFQYRSLKLIDIFVKLFGFSRMKYDTHM